MNSITVNALKSDGFVYRSCKAKMELETDQGCVVWSPIGTSVFAEDKLLYEQDVHVRAFYAYGARLNLLEVYESNDQLLEIYLNIIAPMESFSSTLVYVDLELDVSKIVNRNESARVVDVDEFEEAIKLYNYDLELVSNC